MIAAQEKDVICQDCVNKTDCPLLDMLEGTMAYMAICSRYEKEQEPEDRTLFFQRNGQ